MTPVIRCDDLEFSYPGALDLRIARLELLPGLVYCIEGPNGAGKSTLLWLLSGLLEPRGGQVQAFGAPLDRSSTESRRRITLLMEKPYLLRTTVLRNVEYGLARHGVSRTERRARASKALQSLEIEHLADAIPSRLSQGERKRVALARALALETEVLMLDEPTSHVDRKTAVLIEEIIERLRGKTTVVVSTHDIHQSRRLADQVLTMIDGKLSDVSHENVFSSDAQVRDGERVAMLESGWEVPLPSGHAGPVEILIDPHRIQLFPQSTDAPKALVTGMTMERAGVRIELEGSPKLVVRVDRDRLASGDISVGQTISIGFPAEAVRVLKDSKFPDAH